MTNAIVSHDIRNPLNSIKVQTYRIQECNKILFDQLESENASKITMSSMIKEIHASCKT